MSGTNAVAVKRALFDALAAIPELSGVQVAYGYPARDLEREVVYGGAAQWTNSISNLGGMAGIRHREELRLDVHIQVREPGAEVEETDARVGELAGAITAYLAAHERLDELVPGLVYGGVVGGESGYAIEDEAVVSAMTLTLSFTSHLV